MAVTQKDLSQISDYIKIQFVEWMESMPPRQFKRDYKFELHERMIRVEEELKTQRELMKQGFEQIDRRFEQVDRRFEQINKRFEQLEDHFSELSRRMFHFMIWSFGSTATAAGIVITVLKL
jgi:acyl carrier protein phosphodiesterase